MKRTKRLPGTERRAAILDVAVRLFQSNGYAGTSLREIAAAAGIQKASLYYHFESKEKILAAIHDRFMDVLFDRAAERQQRGGSPDDLLAGYILDGLEMMEEYRPHMEVFLRERYELTGELWERARERRREYQSFVRAAIREGIEAGIFKPELDPLIATYGVFGMTNWTHQWFDPSGRLSASEVAEQFTAIVLDGMRKRPHERGRRPSARGAAAAGDGIVTATERGLESAERARPARAQRR